MSRRCACSGSGDDRPQLSVRQPAQHFLSRPFPYIAGEGKNQQWTLMHMHPLGAEIAHDRCLASNGTIQMGRGYSRWTAKVALAAVAVVIVLSSCSTRQLVGSFCIQERLPQSAKHTTREGRRHSSSWAHNNNNNMMSNEYDNRAANPIEKQELLPDYDEIPTLAHDARQNETRSIGLTKEDLAVGGDSDNNSRRPLEERPRPNNMNKNKTNKNSSDKRLFNLATALFCGGLAFDSYIEPPSNSSRWEKGSKGLKVAFVSAAFTRQRYKGLVEIVPMRCIGLPEEESAAERLLSGNGVDACILVAALEGSWKEDVQLLEREQFHEGVLDLSGAAHVVRSTVAWANVDQKRSLRAKEKTGRALPYHVPGGWGRDAQAVWPEPEPFYLYIQDPATVRLVFTLYDADKVVDGKAIGSTHRRLSDLIPQAKLSSKDMINELKDELLRQVQDGDLDILDERAKIQLGAKSWQGDLKLTSKPRKRDKNSQIIAGAAAGAYLAGPVGAAAGALMGNLYESQVKGRILLKLRYLPIPQTNVPRKTYRVFGGMPGIDWGGMYAQYYKQRSVQLTVANNLLNGDDLEHCFYISHENTGATCSVYRLISEKLIVVAFRGTCTPIDLITDANIVQESWVEGDIQTPDMAMVHAGFRSALNSISRRLKELLLAVVSAGDVLSDYDMLITGHSLGGALATLFTADIGQYGVDAGRGLPQLIESEPWWKGFADTLMGQGAQDINGVSEPPRPKSLRLYSFGSPRVGNHAFAGLFDALVGEGLISQAYRVVNGEDVVTRLPRSVNAVIAQIGYEHCGPTVLLSEPSPNNTTTEATTTSTPPLVWVEGESDDNQCPVRDGVALNSPMSEGSLLADLYNATRVTFDNNDQQEGWSWQKLTGVASKVTDRMRMLTAADVASVVGIDRSFTERELRIIQSILRGKALAHHLEDSYFSVLSLASTMSDDEDTTIV